MNHILSKITYYAKNPSDYTFCYILLVKTYFLECLNIISRRIINFRYQNDIDEANYIKGKSVIYFYDCTPLYISVMMHILLSLLLRSHEIHT